MQRNTRLDATVQGETTNHSHTLAWKSSMSDKTMSARTCPTNAAQKTFGRMQGGKVQVQFHATAARSIKPFSLRLCLGPPVCVSNTKRHFCRPVCLTNNHTYNCIVLFGPLTLAFTDLVALPGKPCHEIQQTKPLALMRQRNYVAVQQSHDGPVPLVHDPGHGMGFSHLHVDCLHITWRSVALTQRV